MRRRAFELVRASGFDLSNLQFEGFLGPNEPCTKAHARRWGLLFTSAPPKGDARRDRPTFFARTISWNSAPTRISLAPTPSRSPCTRHRVPGCIKVVRRRENRVESGSSGVAYFFHCVPAVLPLSQQEGFAPVAIEVRRSGHNCSELAIRRDRIAGRRCAWRTLSSSIL